jgi:hypothetical protein
VRLTIFANFGPLRLDEVSFKCLKRRGYFHGGAVSKTKTDLANFNFVLGPKYLELGPIIPL